jgi:hypothetical protein
MHLISSWPAAEFSRSAHPKLRKVRVFAQHPRESILSAAQNADVVARTMMRRGNAVRVRNAMRSRDAM